MSNEKQVEQLTNYMANFIAHIAKKLPDDVIAKLTELRDKEDSPLSKTIYVLPLLAVQVLLCHPFLKPWKTGHFPFLPGYNR